MRIVPYAFLHVTGLVHGNCTRCIFACYRVSTWELYQMHICKLQMINNIPNCDCRQGISFYSTYHSRLCFPDIDSFCWSLFLLFSVECIAIWVSLQLMPFKVIWGFRMLQSFEVLFPARLPLLVFNIISILFVFLFLFISSQCNKLHNYITENVL